MGRYLRSKQTRNLPEVLIRKLFERKYRSLAKEYQWVEHLTSLPNRGVGTLECFRI